MGELDHCVLGSKVGWRKRSLLVTIGHQCGVGIIQGRGIRLKTTAESRWMLIYLSKLAHADFGN